MPLPRMPFESKFIVGLIGVAFSGGAYVGTNKLINDPLIRTSKWHASKHSNPLSGVTDTGINYKFVDGRSGITGVNDYLTKTVRSNFENS